MNPQPLRDKHHSDALHKLLNDIMNQEDFQGLKTINEAFLDALMQKEREIFLRHSPQNKGNGFYERSLATGLGKIDLTIPRDRLSEFRPFLLPEQWQRGEQSYDDLIASLVIHAYSPNKIRSILKSLGLSFSADEVEELKDELYERSLEFKNQQLNEEVFCLYIDAYHTKIKEKDSRKVTKATIHTVIGLDLDGNKEVYGYYEFFGSENKEHWLMVLNDLINRGLKKVLLIISDDFSGLSQAIEALFSKTDHQLCFVHMQRNVRKHMGKEDSRNFIDTLKLLRTFKDFDQAIQGFTNLCEQYQDKYPHFIQALLNNKERYFNFLRYPQPLQKHLYTTNISENFNSRLEVLRVNLGGYFQSQKTLAVAIQVLIDKIKRNRWRNPLPMARQCEYEMHQLFRQRFEPNS